MEHVENELVSFFQEIILSIKVSILILLIDPCVC